MPANGSKATLSWSSSDTTALKAALPNGYFYVNSGTWANLVPLPHGNEDEWLEQIEDDTFQRSAFPTYVKIEPAAGGMNVSLNVWQARSANYGRSISEPESRHGEETTVVSFPADTRRRILPAPSGKRQAGCCRPLLYRPAASYTKLKNATLLSASDVNFRHQQAQNHWDGCGRSIRQVPHRSCSIGEEKVQAYDNVI